MQKENNDYSGEKRRLCLTCKKTKRAGEFYNDLKKQCVACVLKTRHSQDSRPPQKIPEKTYWNENEHYC